MDLQNLMNEMYSTDPNGYDQLLQEAVEKINTDVLEKFLVNAMPNFFSQRLSEWQESQPAESILDEWKKDQQYQEAEFRRMAV